MTTGRAADPFSIEWGDRTYAAVEEWVNTVTTQEREDDQIVATSVLPVSLDSSIASLDGPVLPTSVALDLSTRLRTEGGDKVLITEFIVTGHADSTKKIMVRGLGPSMTDAGISGVLTDRTLELHGATGAVIAKNNNWKETQLSQIAATQIAPTQ
jgi:hypothetical protein